MQKIYFVPIFTKPTMKQLTFIYELAKFMLISVPLACCIYLTAHIYFEIKRLINDRNRQ
jgi:hypothetical protein